MTVMFVVVCFAALPGGIALLAVLSRMRDFDGDY